MQSILWLKQSFSRVFTHLFDDQALFILLEGLLADRNGFFRFTRLPTKPNLLLFLRFYSCPGFQDRLPVLMSLQTSVKMLSDKMPMKIFLRVHRKFSTHPSWHAVNSPKKTIRDFNGSKRMNIYIYIYYIIRVPVSASLTIS